MNLTIKNTGTRKYPHFRIMSGNQEFCSTDNFDNAVLIQRIFTRTKIEMPKHNRQTIEGILETIYEKTGIDLKTNLCRKREIVNLRFIYCKIASENGYTQKEIGIPIHRPHDRVLYACRKFSDYYETDADFRRLYEEITKL